VILAFNNQLMETVISLLVQIRVIGDKLEAPVRTLLAKQKEKLRAGGGDSEGSILSSIFEKFVLAMVAYFVVSIMNSLAQSYVKRLEKERKDKMKKVIKEGGKRGVEIEGAADMGGLQFFCTAVDLPDGDVDLLVESMKAMNAKSDPTEEERKGGSGHVGKMIFSAGVEQLAVVAYVPEAKQGELNCAEWLKVVLDSQSGVVKSEGKDVSTGFVKANSDKGVFPLKIREPMILEANNFLRKKGLFPEDDSDDDENVAAKGRYHL